MGWHLSSPEHQLSLYWLCIYGPLFSTKNFYYVYLRHLSFEKRFNIQNIYSLLREIQHDRVLHNQAASRDKFKETEFRASLLLVISNTFPWPGTLLTRDINQRHGQRLWINKRLMSSYFKYLDNASRSYVNSKDPVRIQYYIWTDCTPAATIAVTS